MKVIGVRVDADLKEAFEKHCEDNQVEAADLLRQMIFEEIHKNSTRVIYSPRQRFLASTVMQMATYRRCLEIYHTILAIQPNREAPVKELMRELKEELETIEKTREIFQAELERERIPK